MIAELTDRAVIAVSGREARAFLQGLVTNDAEKVAPGRAFYAALLTPQGKILFDFLIAESGGALLLGSAGRFGGSMFARVLVGVPLSDELGREDINSR